MVDKFEGPTSSERYPIYQTLPAAAGRWLDHVLPDNAAVPSQIAIWQEGEMGIRGRWTPFKAVGTYIGTPFSFNWRAKLRMMPGIWILAVDGHSAGRGWGDVKLWNLLPMGGGTDPEVLLVQLIRNISELVWMPEFALTSPQLAWSDGGEDGFEIRSQAGDREVMVRFEVNGEGDILRAYSPSRPYDIPGGYAAAPWEYQFGSYRDFDGIHIPSTAVAKYEFSEGSWEYF